MSNLMYFFMFSNLPVVGAMHGTNTKWVPARKRDMSSSHGWTSSSRGKVGFIENFVVKFVCIEI